MDISFIVSAFVAGLFTFLAPCTLPLVPGFLVFISGSASDKVGQKNKPMRFHIFFNALFYVLGFSVIFILFGLLFGLGGGFLAQYRLILARIGGVFIILFGVYMLQVLRLPFLNFLSSTKKIPVFRNLTPGTPSSSFIFGATFALGWTPCIGPILSTILFLASFSETIWRGGFLLLVFSLGLGIPFLVIALFFEWFSKVFSKISKVSKYISVLGGIFLIFIGLSMVFGGFDIWVGRIYSIFHFMNLEQWLMRYF